MDGRRGARGNGRYGGGGSVGEASNFVLLIASGEVACTLADGRTAFTAGPGTPLGSIDAVAERPRWFDAVTSTNVVALHASIEGLLDIFEDNYEMAADYLEVISRAVVTILDQRVARGDSLENFVSGAEPMPAPPAQASAVSGRPAARPPEQQQEEPS